MIEQATNVKKCPFCAELIQDEAIKCRYCGEFLDGRPHTRPATPGMKWYHANAAVIFALALTGPLALPLVWFHPRYKVTTKAIITAIVVVTTILFSYLVGLAYQRFMSQFRALGL